MLEVEGLTKRFGRAIAVEDVSFRVAPGEVVALLGPNGAGKTTTLRMIAGVLEACAGDARIFGRSVGADRIGAQACLGFLPEGAPLWGEATARENVALVARARGLTGRVAAAAVERAARLTDLTPALDARVETLSKGWRRRVALAGAIVHDPPALALDEPTDGLDPNQKAAARDLVRALSPGRVILISTHVLEEVEAICTRAIVIDRGRIVADETPAALAARTPSGRLDDAFRALTTRPADAAPREVAS